MGGASVGVNERCLLRTPTPAHTAIRRRYRGVYAGVVTHGLKNPWLAHRRPQRGLHIAAPEARLITSFIWHPAR